MRVVNLVFLGIILLLTSCAVTHHELPVTLVAAGTDTLYVRLGTADLAQRKDHRWQQRILHYITGESPELQLGRPTAITQSENGDIYICDGDLGQVIRVSSTGFVSVVLGNHEVGMPTGIGAWDNMIAVSDAGRSRVVMYDSDLRARGDLTGSAPWDRPGQIHWDGERLYVVDSGRHIVEVFSQSGEWITSFGGQGTQPGKFLHPVAVATDSEGTIWVIDALNHRIVNFTRDFQPVFSFGNYDNSPGGFMFPRGLDFDSDDNLYVTDAGFNRIQVFSTSGALLYWFGDTGREPGSFLLPSALYVDEFDRIYIADQYNRRVEVYQYFPYDPANRSITPTGGQN